MTKKSWSGAQGTAFVSGIIATLISVTAISLLAWYISGLNVTPPDFEKGRIAEDKVIDSLNVMDTLDTWERLKQMGLPAEEPPWRINQKIATKLKITCGVFAGLGVVGLGAIFYSVLGGGGRGNASKGRRARNV